MNTRCQELGLNNRGGRRTSKRERKSDKRIKEKIRGARIMYTNRASSGGGKDSSASDAIKIAKRR